jgi:RNA 3'-terminal phosphate cyclase
LIPDPVIDHLSVQVPVDLYLADQLRVPMTIDGGEAFPTLTPSRPTWTIIDIIRHFTDLSCDVDENAQGKWDIRLRSEGIGR